MTATTDLLCDVPIAAGSSPVVERLVKADDMFGFVEAQTTVRGDAGLEPEARSPKPAARSRQ